MKKIFFIIILIFISGCSLQKPIEQTGDYKQENNQQSQNDTKTKIIMGTNAEFPPFEYVDENGIVYGFSGVDVALAKEFADENGYELLIENMEFDSLIGAVSSDEIDFIAAGMSINPERLKDVDFTVEYYEAVQSIIVKSEDSSIKKALDLSNKKIGVQKGTTGDYIVTNKLDIKNIANISAFKRGVDAVNALINGEVDAVVIDSEPAKDLVKHNEGQIKLIHDEDYFEKEKYAFAVKKGNKELLNKLNDFLQRKVDSGEITKLVNEYS